MIYSLAGHPLFSAESVMTCNHTQTFSVATLFVFLHFLKHRKPFFSCLFHQYLVYAKIFEVFGLVLLLKFPETI